MFIQLLPGWGMDSRADRAAETRRRIERAALELFVGQGVAATSIRDIADLARISLGAMYNHFTSKEELAWQLFIDGWSEMGRTLRERARAEKTLAAKMRAMIGYVFHTFDADWLLVTYVFTSRHEHLRRVPPTRDNPYMVFRLVIVDAMRRQEIPRKDPELATALVMGAIIQATDSRILRRLKGPLADHVEATATCCVTMLAA